MSEISPGGIHLPDSPEKKAKERARQLERRGIAREFIAAHIHNARSYMVEDLVNSSLELADELLSKTKVDE